jgi:hypothetical protein
MREETTMSARDRLIAAALAVFAIAAAVAAMAAPADAATNGYEMAKFKVEVKGWKKTVQQYTPAAENECDVSNFSSGSETVGFRSKPIVITASNVPGTEAPEFFAGRRLSIPAKATVERSFTPRFGGSAENCGDNGGGVETTNDEDCGKKQVNPYPLRLQYLSAKSAPETLVLFNETTDDPFEACEGANSVGFPYLALFDDESKWIGAKLSTAELFDPKFRKWISTADGTRKFTEGEWWARTTVHWEVSFTRLKGKVPGARAGTG